MQNSKSQQIIALKGSRPKLTACGREGRGCIGVCPRKTCGSALWMRSGRVWGAYSDYAVSVPRYRKLNSDQGRRRNTYSGFVAHLRSVTWMGASRQAAGRGSGSGLSHIMEGLLASFGGHSGRRLRRGKAGVKGGELNMVHEENARMMLTGSDGSGWARWTARE